MNGVTDDPYPQQRTRWTRCRWSSLVVAGAAAAGRRRAYTDSGAPGDGIVSAGRADAWCKDWRRQS